MLPNIKLSILPSLHRTVTNIRGYMADEALVRKACEAYDIRQDGLLDLYYIPDIMYILKLYPTESMYDSIGRAEAEDQYYISIRHAIIKFMEMMQSQKDAKTKTVHLLPSTSPLSSPELDNPKISSNLNAIPPLPRGSPLSSPEFDEDEFRDIMLEKTYQTHLNKVLDIKRKESRDPRIRAKLRRQEQAKEQSTMTQINLP